MSFGTWAADNRAGEGRILGKLCGCDTSASATRSAKGQQATFGATDAEVAFAPEPDSGKSAESIASKSATASRDFQ